MDAFELWCWRRLLRVPWTARRSNQSILKKINPEYSLKGLMLKLKIQYFDHLMWRTDSLEKTLILQKIEGEKRGDDRGWTWVWVNSGNWWWTGNPGVLQSMGSQESDMTEQLNWSEAPLSMKFSRQDYWIWMPYSSLGLLLGKLELDAWSPKKPAGHVHF